MFFSAELSVAFSDVDDSEGLFFDELLFVTEPPPPVQALIAITKHSAVNIPTAFFINLLPFCCYI